jgi:hypothetical protein
MGHTSFKMSSSVLACNITMIDQRMVVNIKVGCGLAISVLEISLIVIYYPTKTANA